MKLLSGMSVPNLIRKDRRNTKLIKTESTSNKKIFTIIEKSNLVLLCQIKFKKQFLLIPNNLICCQHFTFTSTISYIFFTHICEPMQCYSVSSGLIKSWNIFVIGLKIKNKGDRWNPLIRKALMISMLPRIMPFRTFALPPVRIFTITFGR